MTARTIDPEVYRLAADAIACGKSHYADYSCDEIFYIENGNKWIHEGGKDGHLEFYKKLFKPERSGYNWLIDTVGKDYDDITGMRLTMLCLAACVAESGGV